MPKPTLVSLLPARNAASDLPAHLDAVARCADAVIALDDGSTDETPAILEAHPLVHTLLRNPRRDGYAGWDDAATRARLLTAALELEPRWVLWLDADELMTPGDAVALRAFVRGDADPECAYLLRVFRMIDDLEHFDHDALWVGRLFAPRPGHVLPDDRFHFVPIPTAIPRQRWVRSTFRIQHLGSISAERRSARAGKYREVDPRFEWQRSYSHLVAPPTRVRPWYPRGRHLPAIMNGAAADLDPLEPGEPAISAIVISQNDEAIIERAVGAVVRQELDEPFEVILVTSGTDRTAAIVRNRFPSVHVVELHRPALPGEARNAGLRVARGRYVSFPGSHVELAPGSLAARLDAHRRGWAMVTGTLCNGTRTHAGWAAYFLESSSVLPGRPAFVFETAPMRCSYLREALLEIGGFPEHLRAGEDTAANEELYRRGYGAAREPAAVTYHHSPCRRPGQLLAHHFRRGRARGRILVDRGEVPQRQARWFVKDALRAVPQRMRFVHGCVRRWGRDVRAEYWSALPLIATVSIASLLGASYEVARARWSRRAITGP